MRWRTRELGWMMVGLCLAGTCAWGQTGEPSAQGGDTADASGEATVSLEFLEFLGTWETSEGDWVGPQEMQAEDWPADGIESAAGERGDE